MFQFLNIFLQARPDHYVFLPDLKQQGRTMIACRRRLTLLLMTLSFISFCVCYSRMPDEYSAIEAENTIACHRREFTYKVIRKDKLGRKCSGYVKAMSCWGRCDSNEVLFFPCL